MSRMWSVGFSFRSLCVSGLCGNNAEDILRSCRFKVNNLRLFRDGDGLLG